MSRTMSDKYANILSGQVATTGVTPTTQEIATGVSLGEGRGMLIDQIDYTLSAAILLDFVAGASAAFLKATWSTQSLGSSADYVYSNSRLIHQYEVGRYDFGTAGNAAMIETPKTFQFFPALIVAAPKLFLNTYCSAAISGGSVSSRLFFRYIDLKAQEYLELAESFVLVS